ncbi:PREDICTED: uncharacterized protein LOC107185634 [Dufourea novaeangliae]|uniref:Transcription elongation factor, mitochondrial n=1 Tax=Dufourea novaeangliae TaxID=178035 RepID=A0A154P7R4_DUFNO|nr:PREDICTED: uncharacterized protein LOC107185634 [Dufourea novaeangliae]KZC07364.1 Transcription elongation factor, mitochondrial [Dufourea novaeangliae]
MIENIMLRSLYDSLCRVKMQKHLWFHPFQGYSQVKLQKILNDNISRELLLNKENEILIAAHECDKEKLQKYVKGPYAETIILHCVTNGPYKSFNDLLSINNIENDIMKETSISVTDKKVIDRHKRCKIIPTVKKMKERPKATLGIHVGPSMISWAFVNNDFRVLNWDWEPWCNIKSKNVTYNTISMASSIVEKLPEANAYVIEDVQILNKGINRMMLHLQQQLIVSVMACLRLRGRQLSSSSESDVYVMPYSTTARMFNLLVGSEIVSSNSIVKKIIGNAIEPNNKKLCVIMDIEIKEKYARLNCDEQEQANLSLLRALSFLRLIEIQNDLMPKVERWS